MSKNVIFGYFGHIGGQNVQNRDFWLFQKHGPIYGIDFYGFIDFGHYAFWSCPFFVFSKNTKNGHFWSKGGIFGKNTFVHTFCTKYKCLNQGCVFYVHITFSCFGFFVKNGYFTNFDFFSRILV